MLRRECPDEGIFALSTHIAVIALNKDIGLRFLHAPDQTTHGGTSRKGIATLHDKMAVAWWMLRSFMSPTGVPEEGKFFTGRADGTDSSFVQPVFSPEDVQRSQPTNRETAVLADLRSSMDQLLPYLWAESHQDCDERVKFLIQLIGQVEFCLEYLSEWIFQLDSAAHQIVADPSRVLYLKNLIPYEFLFCAQIFEILMAVVDLRAIEVGYQK